MIQWRFGPSWFILPTRTVSETVREDLVELYSVSVVRVVSSCIALFFLSLSSTLFDFCFDFFFFLRPRELRTRFSPTLGISCSVSDCGIFGLRSHWLVGRCLLPREISLDFTASAFSG